MRVLLVNQIFDAERLATAWDCPHVPIVMGLVLNVASSLLCLTFSLMAFSLEKLRKSDLPPHEFAFIAFLPGLSWTLS